VFVGIHPVVILRSFDPALKAKGPLTSKKSRASSP
jgi:hypothetical protein